MLRVYSPSGVDILRENIRNFGGHFDAQVREDGSAYAILGNAESSHVAMLNSLGVIVIPNSRSASVPDGVPHTAETVEELMLKIHSDHPHPEWHPHYAV